MVAAALEIERLEAGYGGAAVLRGISLTLASGEFIALLGASGCGKTTLLRAISGFVPVSAGRVTAQGRDITHLPPDKRGMAMVFQSYALWPHMTAAQNIGYGLKLRRLSRDAIRARVQEILAMLGMGEFGDRSVTRLSGGQRQRVALGRALAVSPEILLLDEPLSNLDARIRVQVRHEIKSIQKKLGISAVHVTHDREEAMVMADRIVILDAGRIAQLGPPEEVYNRPASPFVASFMGADNVVRIDARTANGGLDVAAGPHNRPAHLPAGVGGCHLASPVSGPAVAHFRSEAAGLAAADAADGRDLILRGRITQGSYPGGFYRYAVEVGEETYMVDDQARREPGESVAIRLAAAALHVYPAGGHETATSRH